jgi:hypothetical protein
MFKEIIYNADPYEIKCEKLRRQMEDDKFIYHILEPDDFLIDFLPFSIRALKYFNPEKSGPYSIGNECRFFILKSLSKFHFEKFVTTELISAINDVIETDNLTNVMLAIKIFSSIVCLEIFTENILENHLSVVLILINSIFANLECHNEAVTHESFLCFVELFSYISDLNQNHLYMKKKIDLIVFRCVNFYISFLDNRTVMDMINFKKYIALSVISSVSKLIKIISDTNVFISRNENYSNTILELSKFAIFYCPVDAYEIRKELIYFVFKTIIKSREVFIHKIEEFFDLRFFYSPESYITNIKGLIGLTDILVVFFENFNIRIYNDLLYRTREILDSSLSIIETSLNDDKKLNFEYFEKFDYKDNTFIIEDEKYLVYEKSIIFHLEIVRETINSLNKQIYTIYNSRIQRLEQIEFMCNSLYMLNDSIKIIEKVTETIFHERVIVHCKSIFLSISRIFKELFSKLTDLVKKSPEPTFFSTLKNDLFFELFGSSLNILKRFDFEENELSAIDDYFLIFLLPIDFLFIDLNKHFAYQIIGNSCEKIIFFKLVKKMITEINGQTSCISLYTKLLNDLLVYDFIHLFEKNSIVNENEIPLNIKMVLDDKESEIFKKHVLDRKDDRFNFYNLYFTIVINYYCSNSFSISQYEVSNLMKCLDVLVKTKEVSLHEILLLCFKSLNSMKENTNIFQMYFFKNYKVYISIFYSLYQDNNSVLYLDLIFSLPINLNLILADWGILIKPIIESLKTNNDVGVKALNYLLYLIDNSKKDVFSDKYDLQLIELFHEVKNAISNPKLSIYCAQILGRVKSYHKNFFYEKNNFTDRSFLKGSIFGKTKESIKPVALHTQLNAPDTVRAKITEFSLDYLYVETIQYFRGKYKYSNENRILSNTKYVTFKSTEKAILNNIDELEACFDILAGFIYSVLGWGDYKNYNIEENIIKLSEKICDKNKVINMAFKESDEDIILSELQKSSYFKQIQKSQYIYDSIQALYACENTPLETKAFALMKCISQVAVTYWFCRKVQLVDSEVKIYFNYLLLYKALFEGFENTEKKMPIIILHDLFGRFLNISGSVDNFLKLNVLQYTFAHLVSLCSSSNIRKIRAGCNAISAIIAWDDLPHEWLALNLLSLIRCMFIYVRHSESKYSKVVSTIDCLFDTLRTCKADFCMLELSNLFVNGIMSDNDHERNFSKECLILYKRRFNIKQIPSIHHHALNTYLKDLKIENQKKLFCRIDVLVFLMKNYPDFLSSKDLQTYVKVFYYYLRALNLFSSTKLSHFETDVVKLYSEKFLEHQKALLKSRDFIYTVYYELEDVKSYENYLKYEIAFMYLAFCRNKNLAKVCFDFIFNTLPHGTITPFKKFDNINKKLIDTLLKEKYEECISEVLSVETIKKMICIFNALDNFKDERLVAFIEKIFIEFRNHREIVIFTENAENSILIKTFELSLMVPNQEVLYDKVILMVYSLLYNFSKSYIEKIEERLVWYVEKYSTLTYPLIVQNIMESSMLFLSGVMFKKVVSFRNYVNNLGIANKKLGLPNIIINIGEDEITNYLKTLDLKNFLDIEKGINLLMFLKMIEYSVNSNQIQFSLIIFGELKKSNKNIIRIKEFIRYSINSFMPEDLELLFKIDPLFKICNSVKVKTFSYITNKSIMGCLLKSIEKNEMNSYENLLKFFGDHSWMLIEIFIEENFLSQGMIEYCKNNLENTNILSYVLYYLCHYEPRPEYFDMLLDLSYEERKFTLCSLKKILLKFNRFENSIIRCINSELNYKNNIFILFPLIISNPELLTDNICNELLSIIYRLLKTSIHFYQKIGAHLFKVVCDYKMKTHKNIYEEQVMIDLYTLIFVNFINNRKPMPLDILRKSIHYSVICDFDFVINFSMLNFRSINSQNVIEYLEKEAERHGDVINSAENIVDENRRSSQKDLIYLNKLKNTLLTEMKDSWIVLELSQNLVSFINEFIHVRNNQEYNRETFFNIVKYNIKKYADISSIENIIYERFKIELGFYKNSPQFTFKDNRSPFFNRMETMNNMKYYIPDILNLLVENVKIFKIVPFVIKILKNYSNDKLDISDSIFKILCSELSINENMSMLSIIFTKHKEGIYILKEEDLLNCTLTFLISNKNIKLSTLSTLSELFYYGLTSRNKIIRTKYFQLFNEMLSKDIEIRFYELLSLDWSQVQEKFIPFIFCRMLLETFDDLTISTFRLFDAGISKASCFYTKSASSTDFFYNYETFEKYIMLYVNNFQDFVQRYSPDNFNEVLYDFCYYSEISNYSIIDSLIMKLRRPKDLDLVAENIYKLINTMTYKEKLSLTFLRYLNNFGYFKDQKNIDKAIRYLRNGPDCWFYFAELNDTKTYKDIMLKDYYCASVRIKSKFPETMQASLFQQLGKLKEAQLIFEDLQNKAIESKVSFFEEEYDLILEEWIECSKELQQWDLCLALGKQKNDNLLMIDSLFYTSNFNILTEKQAFYDLISKFKEDNVKSTNIQFYELFIMLFDNFSTDKAIALIKEINKLILLGPNSKSYNNFFMIYLQIIFEMHEISFVFNNSLENNDKISSILFRWEDREPNLENDYLSLLHFSTWRRHAYRKIEDFSNELKFSDISLQEGDISGIVNKNKEYTESIKQLKKSMYYKGNNGLGKNSNYLGLASLKKKYYDNALFSFKNVFDLPSIKVVDAYHKVIYELMCFYEMKDYKLGLDLANSTNIMHFSDLQSSNLFRIRGMFTEKLGNLDEAEQLYFQSIHLSSIGENYYHYVRLIMKNINNHTNQDILEEEIICSILLGLSCSDIEMSRELMLLLLIFMRDKNLTFDEALFKNLIDGCNVNCFIFFIPKLIDLLHSNNYVYIKLILTRISKVYLQAVVLPLILFSNRKENNRIVYSRAQSLYREICNEPERVIISHVLSKFINVVGSVAFNKECELFNLLNDLKENILSSLYKPKDLRAKIKMILTNDVMKSQIENLYPFADSLIKMKNSDGEDLLICPFKILDILIVIMKRLYLLLIGSEDNTNSKFNKIFNEFLVKLNSKKYIFGVYNEIRNDYKNVPYVELMNSTMGKCNPKYDKIEDLYFVGSDGKLYKYEYFKINRKTDNMMFIYNLIKYKLSKSYEIRIREGYLPILKNIQLTRNIFINVVEYSYIDMDFIYEEFRTNSGLNHVIIDYCNEVGCSDHDHTISKFEDKNDSNTSNENSNIFNVYLKIFNDNPNIFGDSLNVFNSESSSRESLENSLALNITTETDTKNINVILEEEYEICGFTPKMSNKVRTKAFINMLDNNVKKDILRNHFVEKFDSPYRYFLFKNSMISSYSTHFMMSYVFHTVHFVPDKIMIYLDKGSYINKKIFSTSFMNELEDNNLRMYLSPNIQYLFGKEGVEGQYLSVLYHSCIAIDDEEFLDNLLNVYNKGRNEDLLNKVKSRIKEVVKIEGNDFNIIKLISEWTDIENMSRVKVQEFPWL